MEICNSIEINTSHVEGLMLTAFKSHWSSDCIFKTYGVESKLKLFFSPFYFTIKPYLICK